MCQHTVKFYLNRVVQEIRNLTSVDVSKSRQGKMIISRIIVSVSCSFSYLPEQSSTEIGRIMIRPEDGAELFIEDGLHLEPVR